MTGRVRAGVRVRGRGRVRVRVGFRLAERLHHLGRVLLRVALLTIVILWLYVLCHLCRVLLRVAALGNDARG